MFLSFRHFRHLGQFRQAGFGVDLACFLVVFAVFGVFEALSITRSAIDGLNSIVLENDAAVASARKKIIIFIAFLNV